MHGVATDDFDGDREGQLPVQEGDVVKIIDDSSTVWLLSAGSAAVRRATRQLTSSRWRSRVGLPQGSEA
eukprot:SAG31_NODE_262_length_18842_cov_22.033346_8_plen_69_part_00